MADKYSWNNLSQAQKDQLVRTANTLKDSGTPLNIDWMINNPSRFDEQPIEKRQALFQALTNVTPSAPTSDTTSQRDRQLVDVAFAQTVQRVSGDTSTPVGTQLTSQLTVQQAENTARSAIAAADTASFNLERARAQYQANPTAENSINVVNLESQATALRARATEATRELSLASRTTGTLTETEMADIERQVQTQRRAIALQEEAVASTGSKDTQPTIKFNEGTNNGSVAITPSGGTTVLRAQLEFEQKVDLNALAGKELDNKNAALAEWRTAHPNLSAAESVQEFDAAVANGTATYERPYTEQRARIQSAENALAVAEAAEYVTPPGVETFAIADNRNSVTVVPLTKDELSRASNDGESAQVKLQGNDTTVNTVAGTDTTAQRELASVDTTTKPGQVSVSGTGQQGSPNASNVKRYRENPLHKYLSYTYNLSLHMLTRSEFNSMAQNVKSWKPSHTIIAGAGRHGTKDNGMTRDKHFKENFYFDGLKITSIIGMNAMSRGTNAMDISFTIIEPNGLSLLDRLIAATLALDEKNYIAMPYLLQIDFFDSEAGLLNDHRKYIPIRIIEMRIKVSAKGAEYTCKAVPFGHNAFLESIGTTPANFEVVAGTLQEFFNSDANANDAAAVQQRIQSANNEGTRAGSTDAGTQTDKTLQVSSFVGAFNAWQQELVNNKYAKVASKIAVVFDPRILANGGNKIIDPQVQPATQAPMLSSVTEAKRANSNTTQTAVKLNQGKFSVNAGTAVSEVINKVVMSSGYVRSQVFETTEGADTAPAATSEKILNWIKVIPHVTLDNFDTTTNKWSTTTTYYVMQYQMWNRSHPLAPKAFPENAKVKKAYSYIYTGKNVDIIDFGIDFDTLFYTSVTVDRGKVQATAGPQQGVDQTNLSKQRTDLKSKEEYSAGPNNPVILNIADDLRSTSSHIRTDARGVAVASVAESLYSGARGDMLNVKMKIVGDPEFIKQDDVYSNPGNTTFKNNLELYSHPDNLVNNSIPMDTSEVFCNIDFFSPSDFDETTGGLKDDGAKRSSVFSGVYRIMMVESEFRSGKFEQSLDLIRLPHQPSDKNTRFTVAENERTSDASTGTASRTDSAGSTGTASSNGTFKVDTLDTTKIDDPNLSTGLRSTAVADAAPVSAPPNLATVALAGTSRPIQSGDVT